VEFVVASAVTKDRAVDAQVSLQRILPPDTGVNVTVGSVASAALATVTTNEPVPVFAGTRASEELQFTVVAPTAKVEPEAGVQATGRAPSTLSVADVAYVTTAPVALVAVAATDAGRVRAGGVVSLTVTVNVDVLVRPRVSDAVQVTVVVAIANVDPLAGAQVTGRAPSTVSFAVAVYVTIAPVGPVASAVIGAGTVMYGS
jgi:hypothetical protein